MIRAHTLGGNRQPSGRYAGVRSHCDSGLVESPALRAHPSRSCRLKDRWLGPLPLVLCINEMLKSYNLY